jgi:hypothetical protein
MTFPHILGNRNREEKRILVSEPHKALRSERIQVMAEMEEITALEQFYQHLKETHRIWCTVIILSLTQKNKNLRRSGIEPEAKPWKGFMLPLHQRRL